jgi:hypothetical protein
MSMLEFYQTHRADDILYAIQCREYYGLTREQVCELAELVFAAIYADPKHRGEEA